jgi:3-hydroxybutyryl-CoA dehydrogenase
MCGVGRMGSQIGCEYLAAGHEVTFVARSPASAREQLDGALALVRRYQLTTRVLLPASAAELSLVDDIRSTPTADIVVESIEESFPAKVELLTAAAGSHPGAVLASNTSSLSITALGEAIGAPERTIGTHYWNPPLLMPLVEVVRGQTTALSTIALVVDTLEQMGKRPVRLERDVPGFVWNRLQFALLREALWLVDEGVATPAVIDEIVRDGLARRSRFTGPFQTAALGGVETFQRIADGLFPELSDRHTAEGLKAAAVADAGRLARLVAERDAGLARELQIEAGHRTFPKERIES